MNTLGKDKEALSGSQPPAGVSLGSYGLDTETQGGDGRGEPWGSFPELCGAGTEHMSFPGLDYHMLFTGGVISKCSGP